MISSVAETIKRINKLVSVRAIRTRYNPEVGETLSTYHGGVVHFLAFVGYLLQNPFECPSATVEGGCELSSGCSPDAFVHVAFGQGVS